MANQCYQKAIQIDSKNSDCLNRIGDALYFLKNYEKAESCYGNVIRLNTCDKTNAHAYNGIGNLYMNKKSYSEAIWSFNQALKLNPNLESAHLNKGLILSQIHKDYYSAKKCIDKSIQIKATSQNLLAKANLLKELNYIYEAVDYYERSIEIESSYEALVGLGNVYLLCEFTAQAILTFEKAIEMNSNESEAYLGKGDAFFQRKQFKEAIHAYDMALSFNKKAEYFNRKGDVLIGLNNFKFATECFSRSLEIDSKNDYALNALGKIDFFIYKKYKEAILRFDSAINYNSKIPEYYFNKGCALFKLMDYKKAFSTYNQAYLCVSNEKISSDIANKTTITSTKLDLKCDLNIFIMSAEDDTNDEKNLVEFFGCLWFFIYLYIMFIRA